MGAVLLIGVVLTGTLHFPDVEIAPHGVALVWIVCSAPLLYVTRAPAVAVVLAYQLCLWLALFVFRGLEFDDFIDRLPFLPALALAAGLALFAIGGTHYRVKAMSEVARAIRIVGLKIVCLALIFLSVEQFATASTGAVSWRSLGASNQVLLAFLGLCAVTAGFAALNMHLQSKVERITATEGPIIFALLGTLVAFALLPLSARVYAFAFSMVLCALLVAAIVISYRRNDPRIVNIAFFVLLVFGGVRYYDVAWPRWSALAFIGGGAVLLATWAIALVTVRKKMTRHARVAEIKDRLTKAERPGTVSREVS